MNYGYYFNLCFSLILYPIVWFAKNMPYPVNLIVYMRKDMRESFLKFCGNFCLNCYWIKVVLRKNIEYYDSILKFLLSDRANFNDIEIMGKLKISD